MLESDELVDMAREEYDVILALSVTKWMHLNWGDPGLKRSFRRMFKQLRPGGKLILEPQLWPSYKKRKKLTVSLNGKGFGLKGVPVVYLTLMFFEREGFGWIDKYL